MANYVETDTDNNRTLLQAFAAMKAELATLRQEVTSLKNNQQTSTANHPAAVPSASVPSTSRRRMLRRLVGTIGAGALIVTAALPAGDAQARLIANPPNGNGQIGAIIVPPGTATPEGSPTFSTSKYGLIATDGSAFNLSNLPPSNTGIYGNGSAYGVYGNGSAYGVYGNGVYGVTGTGSFYGVYGNGPTGVYGNGSTGITGTGSDYGVYGNGSNIGVYGNGSNIGVSGENSSGVGVSATSNGTGLNNPALKANNTNQNGITAVFSSNTLDSCLVIGNTNSNGNLFKAFVNGSQVIRFNGTGKGFFNGGTQTGGADLAEFIPVALDATPGEAELEAGEVVEIDPTQPGLFRRCATTGSLAVAGVISTQPGVTLGAIEPATQENNGPRLALAGRIPVKVTDEGGPIQPGDLLVASSTPGHARRAPFPAEQGSVVGKALGCLNSGAGLVEMLVMLR